MREKLIGEFKNYLALSVVDKDEIVKLFSNAIDETREEILLWTLNNIKAFEDEWVEYRGNKTKGEYFIQRYKELTTPNHN